MVAEISHFQEIFVTQGESKVFDFKEMEELFHVPLRVWSALITHEKIDDMDSLPFFNFSRRVFSFHMQDLFHFL